MANAWSSSPSSSLDALSSQSPSSVFLVGLQIVLTLPRRLWDAYVAYLWHYQPNSWVGRVASAFRVLAVALILPVVLLTLLDVTSYVIARTLGVVDDVKASTSDADTTPDERRMGVAVAVPVSTRVPTVFVSEGPVRSSEGLAPEDSVEGQTSGDGRGDGREGGDGRGSETIVGAASATMRARAQAETRGGPMGMEPLIVVEKQTHGSEVSPRAYYFAGEDLRLAGEGVFSPAVSMPPSPLTPRMPLHTFTENDGSELGLASEGVALKRRVRNARDDVVHT